MKFRAILLALGAMLVLAACDDGPSYDKKWGDDEYDLEAMVLTDDDMPAGILRQQERSFDNSEWSEVFGADDPELKKNQLDAQGRLRNFVAYFAWDEPIQHLGRTISVTSQSTLYVDEQAARDAIRKYACGLLIDDKDPLEEFQAPRLADQSVAFFVVQEQENFGKTVDTAICFRTGRVVHAVMQTGLEGTEDVSLGVKLARRMLARVNPVFDGKKPPSLEEPTPDRG